MEFAFFGAAASVAALFNFEGTLRLRRIKMSNNTEDKSGANIRKSVSEEEIKLFKRALTEAVSAQIDKAIEESKDIDKAKNQ